MGGLKARPCEKQIDKNYTFFILVIEKSIGVDVTKVIARLAFPILIFTILIVLSACATYNIGDTGPAGGYIFYDKGRKTDGWRYLEAAPDFSEFTTAWGFIGSDVNGTDTSIGSGEANTRILMSVEYSELSKTAAYKCSKLNIKGYKDWFLPSKDELDAMYRVLHLHKKGVFENGWYWSSSVGESHDNLPINQYTTWVQDFSEGTQTYIFKFSHRNNPYNVRGVRAF